MTEPTAQHIENARRTKQRCPICGDPQPFILWVDPEPPEECPYGATEVTNCSYQMTEARRAAEWRRICPEAFDSHGNIKKGGLALVMARLAEMSNKAKQERKGQG